MLACVVLTIFSLFPEPSSWDAVLGAETTGDLLEAERNLNLRKGLVSQCDGELESPQFPDSCFRLSELLLGDPRSEKEARKRISQANTLCGQRSSKISDIDSLQSLLKLHGLSKSCRHQLEERISDLIYIEGI